MPKETLNQNPPYVDTDLGRDYLKAAEVPEIPQEQINKFSKESIRQKPVENFDANLAVEAIKNNEGTRITAIDLGGGKLSITNFVVEGGKLKAESVEIFEKENDGANYIAQFERVAEKAKKDGSLVAISAAGQVEGTKSLNCVNAPKFKEELDEKYHGDFAEIFGDNLKAVNNDAQAGIKTAIVAAKESGQLKEGDSLVFIICGGGFGGALYIGNEIMATEVGHAELVDLLNTYNVKTACGMGGNQFTCLEVGGAGGNALEKIHEIETGEHLSGKQISEKYKNGDAFSIKLYKHTATLVATGGLAITESNGLMQKGKNDTVFAYHGGGCKVPGLMDKVTQIFGNAVSINPSEIRTIAINSISDNSSAEGVAIAALYQKELANKSSIRVDLP